MTRHWPSGAFWRTVGDVARLAGNAVSPLERSRPRRPWVLKIDSIPGKRSPLTSPAASAPCSDGSKTKVCRCIASHTRSAAASTRAGARWTRGGKPTTAAAYTSLHSRRRADVWMMLRRPDGSKGRSRGQSRL